jgi:exodeoxyribonuclease VII small subunit
MGKKVLNYENAMAEIEMIVEGIENNQFSIDELAEKVKRISELVIFCKEKLRQTEDQVNKILNEIKE